MTQIPETPAVLIDLAVVDRNIERTQRMFDALGIESRPHIKTHKIPEFAKKQIAAGARGITCQKIDEAEVMAAAGIADIMITYNILGSDKLRRLVAVSNRCTLSVTADDAAVVDGLSAAFSNEQRLLEVLVECDTGMGRCGVQSPEAARDLARRIAAAPGLKLGGLMTYPPMTDMAGVNTWLEKAKAHIEADGHACPRISNGGTPNLARAGDVTVATEHRAGTYIYNDRSLVEAGACAVEDCALTVETTVVSRPTDDRAIIDAGSKSLTSDLIGLTGYGLIAVAPGAAITGLSEEHGIVDLSGTDWRPAVGERISVIPNHACPVSNLVDQVHGRHADGSIKEIAVAARGCSR